MRIIPIDISLTLLIALVAILGLTSGLFIMRDQERDYKKTQSIWIDLSRETESADR